jgi:hypothetical protein
MSPWNTFIALVGAAGSLLTIYEFIKARTNKTPGSRQLAFVFGAVTLAFILVSVIFANILSPLLGTGPGITPTQSINTPQSGIGNTPTQGQQTTPTQVPPTPTTIPKPAPDTVLYQAGQSWNGWNGTADWKVSGGLLLNDGTYADYNARSTIVAPYQSQTADYAIDIQMQVVRPFTTGTIYPCFYITLRGTALSKMPSRKLCNEERKANKQVGREERYELSI